jgi:hypothetical protein
MTMTRAGNERRDVSREITQAMEEQRRETEDLAEQLAEQSRLQWRKTIEGMLALPTAVATSFASSTLYLVSFVARGFEIFQRTAEETSRSLDEQRDRERRERGEFRPGEGQPPGDETRPRA